LPSNRIEEQSRQVDERVAVAYYFRI